MKALYPSACLLTKRFIYVRKKISKKRKITRMFQRRLFKIIFDAKKLRFIKLIKIQRNTRINRIRRLLKLIRLIRQAKIQRTLRNPKTNSIVWTAMLRGSTKRELVRKISIRYKKKSVQTNTGGFVYDYMVQANQSDLHLSKHKHSKHRTYLQNSTFSQIAGRFTRHGKKVFVYKTLMAGISMFYGLIQAPTDIISKDEAIQETYPHYDMLWFCCRTDARFRNIHYILNWIESWAQPIFFFESKKLNKKKKKLLKQKFIIKPRYALPEKRRRLFLQNVTELLVRQPSLFFRDRWFRLLCLICFQYKSSTLYLDKIEAYKAFKRG